MKRLTLLLALLFCIALPGRAENLIINDELYHELQRRLAEATTPEDSLEMAMNIFDLNYGPNPPYYGEMAYRLAKRIGNAEKETTMIRNLSYSYTDSLPALESLIDRISLLPNSSMKRSLTIYLNMRKIYYNAYNLPTEERTKKIEELVKTINSSKPSGDLQENIRQLFEVCIYLHSIFDQSALLAKYYDQLRPMIEALPKSHTAIRNLFYSQAALSFSKQFLPEKSIEYDKAFLESLEATRKNYINEKRRYRTLDKNFYDVYSRMLSNHSVLSGAEVEKYYGEILKIAARNSMVAAEMKAHKRPQIYYYMATKQYDKALPLLKEQIDSLTPLDNDIYFYRALRDASLATGDKDAYALSAKAYINKLEEYINNRSSHNLQELTLTFDVNQLTSEKQQLEEARNKERNDSLLRQKAFAIISAVVLLVVAIIFMLLWRKKQKSAAELDVMVGQLRAERDNLQRIQADLVAARDKAKVADRQKTEFIHLISNQVKTPMQAISEYTGLIVDCMDTDKQKYLKRFAEVVKLNTELINSMVNDITEVSALEARRIDVSIHPSSLRETLLLAIDSVKPTLHDGLTISLCDAPDLSVQTDQRRLEQIITNLLENSVKFSERGDIAIGYSADLERTRLIITVTDHGRGIPADKREMVFERFTKLDNSVPGLGLGLYATRLLVHLLDGEIHIDPNIERGTRMVVELHCKIKEIIP